MCEIAILDPREYSKNAITDAAMRLYRQQGSSLGIVFIQETQNNTKFNFEIFKAVDPEVAAVSDFVSTNNDDSLRVIIHGRMATHGGVTKENAHPIDIVCNECNIDYVLHNGVVLTHKTDRKTHKSKGHSYETDVDSETIAHQWGEVPSDFDHDEVFYDSEPAYILLNEDRVFVYNGGRYQMDEKGIMATRHRFYAPKSAANYQQLILTPTNAE